MTNDTKREMTAGEIAEALIARDKGWKPTIVCQREVPDLVDVVRGHLMKCVDGRPSDNIGMAGPKTLGGIYAIASLRRVTKGPDLKKLVEEVLAAGYIPSIHGDDQTHPSPLGCGYFKLWKNCELGLAPPEFSAAEGAQAVIAAGGAYERLTGAHSETEVVINLVPGRTLRPSDPQRFVVDAWIAKEFGLDAKQYLSLAAQTVELLTKKARVTQVRIVK